MTSPSGTSAAISPAGARKDGKQLVFLAAGSTLYAYDVGHQKKTPASPAWRWDAGLPVGGSPTVFLPGELKGGAGGGPAVAVLSGFRGVTMVQDRPGEDCDPKKEECCMGAGSTARRCKVLYDTNVLPFDGQDGGAGKTRAQKYFGGEAVTLAVGSSVPEAGDKHFYVAFSQGPAHDTFYDDHGIGNWEDLMPVKSHFSVVRIRDGKIKQSLPIDEAPICDSTLGKDQKVYSIHTSGLAQIKHVLYPKVFAKPMGGIIAYAGK